MQDVLRLLGFVAPPNPGGLGHPSTDLATQLPSAAAGATFGVGHRTGCAPPPAATRPGVPQRMCCGWKCRGGALVQDGKGLGLERLRLASPPAALAPRILRPEGTQSADARSGCPDPPSARGRAAARCCAGVIEVGRWEGKVAGAEWAVRGVGHLAPLVGDQGGLSNPCCWRCDPTGCAPLLLLSVPTCCCRCCCPLCALPTTPSPLCTAPPTPPWPTPLGLRTSSQEKNSSASPSPPSPPPLRGMGEGGGAAGWGLAPMPPPPNAITERRPKLGAAAVC